MADKLRYTVRFIYHNHSGFCRVQSVVRILYSSTFTGALAILCYSLFSISVFASSPSFSEQEIIDVSGQWIDLNTEAISRGGNRNTDIVSVDYSSNGTTLDAVLWLLFPFKENSERKNVNYGMFVDADSKSRTRFGGINYQIEIRWDNETKKWNKFIESWSPCGETRIGDNKTDYKNFYENGSNYVFVICGFRKKP